MTSRERLLTALERGKPDHLPAQVHGWMPFYLNTYLGGCNDYEAYERFGMDSVIYVDANHIRSDKALADWQVDFKEFEADGNRNSQLD